ncbi:phosphoribosylanthranilate isomerase [Thermodesulfatator autotrophicus]|uniref:N-(5'-phosphoribosyl)anthranilate isomerase n=1 Tax=Thermodesulfatator autotrophicus TaxID=1795632 RepID=A0A177EAV8_9BACT|nr:phosphoribosylanthranilate isomerase [Thermodesulfatator autotrophicus]OAG28322.1 N-(5'-phosphoribosyl)anthranilate isomerase [Thermodesulfatator autotrophicus]
MIRVKICGITRDSDAELAVQLGAHAIGFIFYLKSPRYLPIEKAREIRQKLPPFVNVVGVFVDEDPQTIKEIAKLVSLDFIQLHGKESPWVCEKFFPRVIKAFRIKDEKDLQKIPDYKGKVSAILLDTYVKGELGGTGRVFDWRLAIKAKKFGIPIILAGGLNPHNVVSAVKSVSPYAIDLSSGIEIAPGVKHPFLLKELFKNLKGL